MYMAVLLSMTGSKKKFSGGDQGLFEFCGGGGGRRFGSDAYFTR